MDLERESSALQLQECENSASFACEVLSRAQTEINAPEAALIALQTQSGSTFKQLAAPEGETTTPVSGYSMDPLTGLRRTQISTPLEKALKFVEETEPKFRVKKVTSSTHETAGA